MRNIVFILLCLATLGCQSCKSNDVKKEELSAAEVGKAKRIINDGEITLKIYDFDGLEPLLHIKDDNTYIVNFWATWCKPCIEELPSFERIGKEYSDDDVKVILVSLDMPSMIESSLLPFIRKNKLNSSVVMLDDPKMNRWIPEVDEEWGGAIPATLIYNGVKREFHESSFTYDELNKLVTNFIKN